MTRRPATWRCGRGRSGARACRPASRRHRLLHRRHGHARLLLSGDRLSRRHSTRRPGKAGLRHRDRLQRIHLRLDRRFGPDPLRRLPPRHADRRRDALEDSRQRRSLDRDSLRRRRRRGDPGALRGGFVSRLPISAPTGAARSCCTLQGSGSRQPLDHAALDAKLQLIHMHGREVFQVRRQQDGRVDRLGAYAKRTSPKPTSRS